MGKGQHIQSGKHCIFSLKNYKFHTSRQGQKVGKLESLKVGKLEGLEVGKSIGLVIRVRIW